MVGTSNLGSWNGHWIVFVGSTWFTPWKKAAHVEKTFRQPTVELAQARIRLSSLKMLLTQQEQWGYTLSIAFCRFSVENMFILISRPESVVSFGQPLAPCEKLWAVVQNWDRMFHRISGHSQWEAPKCVEAQRIREFSQHLDRGTGVWRFLRSPPITSHGITYTYEYYIYIHYSWHVYISGCLI